MYMKKELIWSLHIVTSQIRITCFKIFKYNTVEPCKEVGYNKTLL